MVRKTFFTMALVCILVNVFGAGPTGQITGKVIDSKTKEPLEFVNVTLKKSGTTDYLPNGGSTDSKGEFSLKNIPYGNYTVIISFIGYNTFEQDVVLNQASNKLVIKEIQLEEDIQFLEEVQVVEMRSQMRFDIDKRVFSVDQSIVTAGSSVSELLSNIPSVDVDNEGEVSLRGNSSVTIWINGKASGLTADNRAQILEQIPAETIERIELITNPSAKYSPEGTAGIINIILKKDRKAGYYGSIQGSADTRGGYNVNGNINYNSNKWDIYGSLGYRHRERRGGGYSDRLNFIDGDTTFLNSVSKNTGHNNNIFVRFGLTYRITPVDHLSFNSFGMTGKGKGKNTINYLSDMTNYFNESTRINRSDDKNSGGNFEINYKHEFSETSNIDFTASYHKWNRDEDSRYTQNSLYENNRKVESFQLQEKEFNNNSYELQLDYVNSITENSKIEAGYKGSFGREDSPVETWSGTTETNAVVTPELFNRFIYNKDIQALYATFSGRFNNLGYQFGLRGEYSDIRTKSLTYGESKADRPFYKDDYFSLFPSFFISYTLPADNEVQFNYTRRISRPWGGQLNSFVNITDSTNISYGNPYLSPQFSNSFELNYIKNWEKHVLSFSGYYKSTSDVIQRIRFLEGNVMKSTNENVAKSRSTGVELVLKNKFFQKVDLTTTANIYYYKLDAFSYLPAGYTEPITGKSEEDFTWNVKSILNMMLPYSFSLQITGNYNSKQVISQGYQKPNYFLDAGFRKSFKDFSLSVSGRDLLDSRKRHSITSADNFRQDAESWWGGRSVNFSLTYSFGNMKPKKNKNRDSEIRNEYDMEF